MTCTKYCPAGYMPCTRAARHTGPCAHPIADVPPLYGAYTSHAYVQLPPAGATAPAIAAALERVRAIGVADILDVYEVDARPGVFVSRFVSSWGVRTGARLRP